MFTKKQENGLNYSKCKVQVMKVGSKKIAKTIKSMLPPFSLTVPFSSHAWLCIAHVTHGHTPHHVLASLATVCCVQWCVKRFHCLFVRECINALQRRDLGEGGGGGGAQCV